MPNKVYLVAVRQDVTYTTAVIAPDIDEARKIVTEGHAFDAGNLLESAVFFDPDTFIKERSASCVTTVSRPTEASQDQVTELGIEEEDLLTEAEAGLEAEPEDEADMDQTATAASPQNAHPEGVAESKPETTQPSGSVAAKPTVLTPPPPKMTTHK